MDRCIASSDNSGGNRKNIMAEKLKHSRMCGNYPVEGQCLVKTECGVVCDCKCHKNNLEKTSN